MDKININNTNPTIAIKNIAQVGKLLSADKSLLESEKKIAS